MRVGEQASPGGFLLVSDQLLLRIFVFAKRQAAGRPRPAHMHFSSLIKLVTSCYLCTLHIGESMQRRYAKESLY
jgi:hypothetical protein